MITVTGRFLKMVMHDDELLFRSRCTTTKLSFFPHTLLPRTVPEIRTTGGTTPIVTHCATRAEFLRHSMYEAVSVNAIRLMNRKVFMEKRDSARVFYSLSTICLLQLKCSTRNVTR